MDELLNIMLEILVELKEINSHLSDIKGTGVYSMDDIYSELNKVVEEIDNVKGSLGYDLTDIHRVLSDIDDNTSRL